MGSPAQAFHMHSRKEPIRCIQYYSDKKQLLPVLNQANFLKMAVQLFISEQQFKEISQFWEYLSLEYQIDGRSTCSWIRCECCVWCSS